MLSRGILFLFGVLFWQFWTGSACNEALCGSVVMKCMLLKSCYCEVRRPGCLKTCTRCLGALFNECCECLDACPKPDEPKETTESSSEVITFPHPIPSLFTALTSYPDCTNLWTRYQVRVSEGENSKNVVGPKEKCTVVFIHNCIVRKECQDICRTMGSSSCRWSSNGCCECIGQKCNNHGIKNKRCQRCSLNKVTDYSKREGRHKYYSLNNE